MGADDIDQQRVEAVHKRVVKMIVGEAPKVGVMRMPADIAELKERTWVRRSNGGTVKEIELARAGVAPTVCLRVGIYPTDSAAIDSFVYTVASSNAPARIIDAAVSSRIGNICLARTDQAFDFVRGNVVMRLSSFGGEVAGLERIAKALDKAIIESGGTPSPPDGEGFILPDGRAWSALPTPQELTQTAMFWQEFGGLMALRGSAYCQARNRIATLYESVLLHGPTDERKSHAVGWRATLTLEALRRETSKIQECRATHAALKEKILQSDYAGGVKFVSQQWGPEWIGYALELVAYAAIPVQGPPSERAGIMQSATQDSALAGFVIAMFADRSVCADDADQRVVPVLIDTIIGSSSSTVISACAVPLFGDLQRGAAFWSAHSEDWRWLEESLAAKTRVGYAEEVQEATYAIWIAALRWVPMKIDKAQAIEKFALTIANDPREKVRDNIANRLLSAPWINVEGLSQWRSQEKNLRVRTMLDEMAREKK